MNIVSLGWGSVCSGEKSFRLPENAEFLLVLARNGIRFNGEILSGDSLFILDKTGQAEYSAAGEYMVCDWICFNAGGDGEFMESAELVFNEPFLYPDSSFISGLIANITSEFYSVSSRRMKMLDVMMKTLLMKAAECCTPGISRQTAAEPHYGALIELREKIYRNPQMKWNVDSMAADVNMSRSYFQHMYREIFGVSCMTDVINGKLEKAKELLSETGCTVSQVAAMCGYDNEEHFMRQFKKIVGVTPTGYRRKT